MNLNLHTTKSGAGGMFATVHARMSEEKKQVLKNNKQKMTNMMDAVATYLANVLCIKDKEVAGKLPLVEVARQEIHHLLHMLDIAPEIDELAKTYMFVLKAEDLAERMHKCALRSRKQNINVGVFVDECAYYCDDVVYKVMNGNMSKVEVGAYGYYIMCEIEEKALKWLDALERVMCTAACITMTEAANKALVTTKRLLARGIGKRMALMSTETVLEDELSSRTLEKMALEEFQRCAAHSLQTLEVDKRGIEMIRDMVTEPEGERSRSYLTNCLEMLNCVVHNCPVELIPYRGSMHLDQLARALGQNMDVEVRVALVVFWAENNRTAVLRSLQLAGEEMNQWQSLSTRSALFSTVLCEERVPHALAIPQMPFLHGPTKFARCKARPRRTGLDEKGERAVRMIQCVWEMVSRGIIQGGIVASEIVEAVALDGMLIGRMAAGIINAERGVNKHGARLTKFFGVIQNMEGDHADVIANAACSLSHFSCDELETVFHTDSDILWERKKELENRTRTKMVVYVPEEYRSFASEALAYALPILQKRRDALGVCRFLRPISVFDLLCSIRKFKTWTPLQGTFRVHLEDLRTAHSSTRTVLDLMHINNVLVRRRGGGVSKERVCYEFDTALLNYVMQSPVNIQEV